MSCENRLGKLEIPNGLAGPPGTAGINGAGWESGSADPRGTPAADILFYLNINSGRLFKWTGSGWDPIVDTIFGTDGNVWLTGAVTPTAPTATGNFYYNTADGNIYQYTGVSWGSPIANIQGQNGAPGTNGSNASAIINSAFKTSTLSVGSTSAINIIDPTGFDAGVLCPTDNSLGMIQIRSNIVCLARPGLVARSTSNFDITTLLSDQLGSTEIIVGPQSGYGDSTTTDQLKTSAITPQYSLSPATSDKVYVSIDVYVFRRTLTSYSLSCEWSISGESGFINRAGSFMTNSNTPPFSNFNAGTIGGIRATIQPVGPNFTADASATISSYLVIKKG
jgi:hypothetical protein